MIRTTGGRVGSGGREISQTESTTCNISITQVQFSQLLNSNGNRQPNKTFSTCSARYNGGRNAAKVQDFIATILVYKQVENITDLHALLSFPLLLKGYAASWWQGVKDEAQTFGDAIKLLKSAFSPPNPDWRVYAEICQDRQQLLEDTDSFICRKRTFFAEL